MIFILLKYLDKYFKIYNINFGNSATIFRNNLQLFWRMYYFFLVLIDRGKMEKVRKERKEKVKQRKLKEKEDYFISLRRLSSNLDKYINIYKYKEQVASIDNLEKKIIEGIEVENSKNKFEKQLRKLGPKYFKNL